LRRLFQSWRSLDRSISSAVQKEASAFLYICQTYSGVLLVNALKLWFDACRDASNTSNTWGDTYIVVLDGEKDKAVGVFLEKRLVCLLLLDGWRDTSLCDRCFFWEIWDADDGPENIFLIR
jgi:hypothetical protein